MQNPSGWAKGLPSDDENHNQKDKEKQAGPVLKGVCNKKIKNELLWLLQSKYEKAQKSKIEQNSI